MPVFAKGRNLGLDLESPQNAKRFRYSIIIFACWALIITSAITFFIYKFALTQQDIRLDLDINEPWYLRRADWNALPDFGKDLLNLPVHYVLIGHSAVNICTEKHACIKDVLEIQNFHHGQGWNDIGPNFLVGGNGLVFEGRGANIIGVMVRSWNTFSITVMFLGNYVNDEPTEEQFTNVNVLLKELVKRNVLTPDYIVLGHCQVEKDIITPGPKLMDKLHHFEHWNPGNISFCLRPSSSV